MNEVEKTPEEILVEEALENLAAAKAKAAFKEFPKWLEPHPSHIHQKKGMDGAGNEKVHLSTPHFPDHHVDRDGKVTVLVHDAEDEAKALAAKLVETVKGAQ